MARTTDSVKSAVQKLEHAKPFLLSKSFKGTNFSVRNDEGYQFTAARIRTSIENFSDYGTSSQYGLGKALVNGLMANFSKVHENFSENDLGSVGDVDVADISIAATIASHGLTYIAMERPMDSSTQNIVFQGLQAVNTAGGFNAGDIVYDPRKALNPNINIGQSSALVEATGFTTGTSVSNNKAILRGESKIIDVATGEEIARTVKVEGFANGVESFLFKNPSGFTDGVTINPDNGVVEFTAGSFNGYKVVACIDRTADKTGDSTLRLKPRLDNILMTAQRNRIFLENSIEDIAHMNKIYRNNAEAGITVDFGKRAIEQIVQLYTFYIDSSIVRELWNAAKTTPVEVVIDLSGYNGGDFKAFASTKNDLLSKYVRELNTKFLTRTNRPVTAWIVDTDAALMLANDSDNFKEDPAFMQRRDGFIGLYQNTPVIRHSYLDGKAQELESQATGVIIGVYKSLNGQAAPIAFGDYLPPYSVQPTLNVNNPSEMVSALFSECAIKTVAKDWLILGLMKSY